jgi:putative addiction module killer protein
MALRETEAFAEWIAGVRDSTAAARIAVRIDRLAEGNPGDVRPVGAGMSELRVHHGPEFRVHFVRHEGDIVLLLGGTKKTQGRDIRSALKMAREL